MKMKYFIQMQYTNGFRYTVVEASSEEEAKKLARSEIKKKDVIDCVIIEAEKLQQNNS
jgi:hypothetical protein